MGISTAADLALGMIVKLGKPVESGLQEGISEQRGIHYMSVWEGMRLEEDG